jgi:hypothetical protein
VRAAIAVAVLAWAGCAREGGDVATPPDAEPATRAEPRAPVRSCPTSEQPRDVDVDPRIDIGVAGGASWLFGHAGGKAALLGLGRAGELAVTPVPLQNTQAAAIEGPRIWLYAPRELPDVPARWTAIDVGDPDAPRTGAVTPVAIAARLSFASAFAVGRRRALVVYGLDDGRELALLDTATGAAVRTAALERDLQAKQAFCADDRCAAVAIRAESSGPGRRLVVLRASADAVEDELLAPDWVGEVHVVEAGERVIVQWSGHEGPRLRALDRAGRPLGPAIAAADPSRSFHRCELLPGPAGPVLALGERGRWSFAALAADATPGPLRAATGAKHYFLTGVGLDEGLAWASISGDVSYDELGDSGAMVHSWRTRITAGFTGHDGSEHHADIVSAGGPGRGGFGVWVLVRPGRAAVLTVPEGDASDLGGERARLFPLRAPCPG